MTKLISLLWPVLFIVTTKAYRLNVPRVLLPFHPVTHTTFLLEVKHPEGGCFTWRSNRPDIVSVDPVGVESGKCSDKAIITAKSRHADEQNAIIFATEDINDVTLTCDVTVDIISSIIVETTTRVLFLDAAPAPMIVKAYNREHDIFSTLGSIPFEWSFSNQSRSLRILPFSESNYDAPYEIEELEEKHQQGSIVLVEGIQTGSATLTVKFSEPYFNYVREDVVDLFVKSMELKEIRIIPSEDKTYFNVYFKYSSKTFLQIWANDDERLIPFLQIPNSEDNYEEHVELFDPEEQKTHSLVIHSRKQEVKECDVNPYRPPRNSLMDIFAAFFDRHLGMTLILLITFGFGSLVATLWAQCPRTNSPNHNSTNYAYQSSDGSFDMSGNWSAGPIFQSTPTEPTKRIPASIAQSKRLPNLRSRPIVEQSNNSEGSSFNSDSIVSSPKYATVVNRYYK